MTETTRPAKEPQVPDRAAAIRELASKIAGNTVAVEQIPEAINNLADAVDKESTRRHRQAVVGGGIIFVLGLIVLALVAVAANNRAVLRRIQDQTSPERQAQNEAFLSRLVQDIDQRDRDAFNEAEHNRAAIENRPPVTLSPAKPYTPPRVSATTSTSRPSSPLTTQSRPGQSSRATTTTRPTATTSTPSGTQRPVNTTSTTSPPPTTTTTRPCILGVLGECLAR